MTADGQRFALIKTPLQETGGQATCPFIFTLAENSSAPHIQIGRFSETKTLEAPVGNHDDIRRVLKRRP